MKKILHGKLTINRQTLRVLVDRQLGHAIGGVMDRSDKCPPHAVTQTCSCETRNE